MCVDELFTPRPRDTAGGISRRAFLAGAAGGALAAAVAACTGPLRETGRAAATGPLAGTLPSADPADLSAGPVPRMVLERVWRGIHPGRAGDVVWVPAGYNFLDGGISHAVPWPYMQRVPMVWYGPGVIRAQGRVNRWVTAADVAPTLARLVGFDFEAPDGEPMEEIVEPGAEAPRLIVVFVWDGAGRYVLDLWPGAWPNLRRLLPLGTWFENATAGSSPPTTAPIHSTMGTGAFPRLHGVLDNWIRFEDGRVADPWSRGPAGLLLPTLADQYEEATSQRAQIATFATLAWHLGMMGHGTQYSAASRQIAVLRQSGADTGAEGVEWGLPGSQEDHFRFPEYVRDLPPISSYFREVDASDGTVDGMWMGHEFEELKEGSTRRLASPTRAGPSRRSSSATGSARATSPTSCS